MTVGSVSQMKSVVARVVLSTGESVSAHSKWWPQIATTLWKRFRGAFVLLEIFLAWYTSLKSCHPVLIWGTKGEGTAQVAGFIFRIQVPEDGGSSVSDLLVKLFGARTLHLFPQTRSSDGWARMATRNRLTHGNVAEAEM